MLRFKFSRSRYSSLTLAVTLATLALSAFAQSVPPASTGIFRRANGNLAVVDTNGDGWVDYDNLPPDKVFIYPLAPDNSSAGDKPVTGDWNGDGRSKIGVFRHDGYWILDFDGDGAYNPSIDPKFAYTAQDPNNVPVVGDWNHSGTTKTGVYRNGTWYVDYNGDRSISGGQELFVYLTYAPGDEPVVGNWDGSGFTRVGVFRTSWYGAWYLDKNGNGIPDNGEYHQYTATPGDKPVVGDWNGSGTTKTGVFRDAGAMWWYLDYNGNGVWDDGVDKNYAFTATSGDTPVVGDWTGTGSTKTGIYRSTGGSCNCPGLWILNAQLAAITDYGNLGQSMVYQYTASLDDQPVVGKWSTSTALRITTPWNLTSTTAGSPYAQQLGAMLGAGARTWSVDVNCPSYENTQPPCKPSWLSLSSDGLLSGTPTAPGPFGVWLKVTDGASNVVKKYFSLNVAPTGPVSGISPSKIEINIGPFYIDKYMSLNTDGLNPLINGAGCSQTMTVRQCYQLMFYTGPNSWRSQGVTGVRLFLAMGGGAYSTPFTGSGDTVSSVWRQNLQQFFLDLKSYGIERVTPTPVWDGWTGGPTPPVLATVETCGITKELYFYPWLPWGLDVVQQYPDNTCVNASYETANGNTVNFWGWTRFFNLIDAILAEAQTAQILVDSLDYFQETNMVDFPIQARVIYDPKRQVDVLSEVRSRMSARGFDPLKATVSANNIWGEPVPPYFDCTSIYGESALVIRLSALTEAIKGPNGRFGSTLAPDTTSGGLYCWDPVGEPIVPNLQQMARVSVYHDQPTIVDMHTQRTFTYASDTAVFAKNLYSAIWEFLSGRGMTGSKVVIGETNPVHNTGCSQWTYEQASAMVNGTAANGYRNSQLYLSHASNVVFRPWQNTLFESDPCTPGPNVINPPFNPTVP